MPIMIYLQNPPNIPLIPVPKLQRRMRCAYSSWLFIVATRSILALAVAVSVPVVVRAANAKFRAGAAQPNGIHERLV